VQGPWFNPHAAFTNIKLLEQYLSPTKQRHPQNSLSEFVISKISIGNVALVEHIFSMPGSPGFHPQHHKKITNKYINKYWVLPMAQQFHSWIYIR
jgi:hypothetical protein